MAGQSEAGHWLGVQRFELCWRFLASGVVSQNWGPTLRGGFGLALRRVCCSLGRDTCRQCELARCCAYGYVFETPVFADATVMRKYPEAPHPFVFEPNQNGKSFVREGEQFCSALVLVGHAISYLPQFFLALEELGAQGLGRGRVRYRVERIATSDGQVIYQRGLGSQFRRAELKWLSLEPGTSATGRFDLVFQTPTRIVVAGQLSADFGLLDIVKALSRRVFLLRYFHCGGCTEPIADEFLEAARDARCLSRQLTWVEAERFSTRQQRTIPIGGVVGRITCEGDLGLLRPLLRAGQYVHVGKNATFGLGKFTVVEGSRA